MSTAFNGIAEFVLIDEITSEKEFPSTPPLVGLFWNSFVLKDLVYNAIISEPTDTDRKGRNQQVGSVLGSAIERKSWFELHPEM